MSTNQTPRKIPMPWNTTIQITRSLQSPVNTNCRTTMKGSLCLGSSNMFVPDGSFVPPL
jgi:hypothetical protein